MSDDVFAVSHLAALDAAQHKGRWLISPGQAETLLSDTLLALGDRHGHLATPQDQRRGDGHQVKTGGVVVKQGYVVGFYLGSQPNGIRRGDQLRAIDGVPDSPTQKEQSPQFQDRLRLSGSHDYLLERAGQSVHVQIRRSEVALVMQPYAARLGRNIAYVQMPFNGFPVVTAQAQTRYVQANAQALAGVAAPALCGVIFDLRLDRGGDPLSQLKVASLVLGSGVFGEHEDHRYTSDVLEGVDSNGTAYEGTIPDNAYSYARQLSVTTPAAAALSQQHPAVAVLIGDDTASSGEIVALGARSRARTRMFGTPTYGDTTIVLASPLPGGALLYFSGAFFKDASGRAYPQPITPDQTVRTDWATFGTSGDPVIRAAQQWLGTQGCPLAAADSD